MTAPFKPPRGVTVEFPYRTAVLRADPDFEYGVRHQLFYEFANGRRFFEDETQHGAYLPGAPVSVTVSGVGATGGAGLTLPMQSGQLLGLSAVGKASHIVAVGGEDDLALAGVAAVGSAGTITATQS